MIIGSMERRDVRMIFIAPSITDFNVCLQLADFAYHVCCFRKSFNLDASKSKYIFYPFFFIHLHLKKSLIA